MNITARLVSRAGAGEILVREFTCKHAALHTDVEKRTLALKGRSEPGVVHVLKVKEPDKTWREKKMGCR